MLLYWSIIITLLILVSLFYYLQTKHEICEIQKADYEQQLSLKEHQITEKDEALQLLMKNSRVFELSEKIRLLESGIRVKNEKISDLERASGSTSAEISDLRGQIKVLENQISDVEMKKEPKEDYKRKIYGLEEQIKRLSKFQKMIIDLRRGLKDEGLHLTNHELQKTKLIEIIRKFTIKYAFINTKQFPNRLLGIGKDNKWIISEPMVQQNIKDASNEYLFALDEENIIVDYNTFENVLIPKYIDDSNNRNVMIENPQQDDRDQWSKLCFNLSRKEPYFSLITVENLDDFVLMVNNGEPYISKYNDNIKNYIVWDLQEID